jgi:hypothetical protein
VAASSSGAMNLAGSIVAALAADAAPRLAGALIELVGRTDELTLDAGVTAVGELHRRGGGPSATAIAIAARNLGANGEQVARALS